MRKCRYWTYVTSHWDIYTGYADIIIAITVFKMYDYFTTKYRRFSKMIVAKPILLWKNGKILENVWWMLEFKRRISIIFET